MNQKRHFTDICSLCSLTLAKCLEDARARPGIYRSKHRCCLRHRHNYKYIINRNNRWPSHRSWRPIRILHIFHSKQFDPICLVSQPLSVPACQTNTTIFSIYAQAPPAEMESPSCDTPALCSRKHFSSWLHLLCSAMASTNT